MKKQRALKNILEVVHINVKNSREKKLHDYFARIMINSSSDLKLFGRFEVTERLKIFAFFEQGFFITENISTYGWAISRHGAVLANQSIVVGQIEPFDWIKATELYLLSNQNGSLY